MKKLFLLTFFTLFSLCLTAQTEKGNWFFGADTSLGFTSSNAQAESEDRKWVRKQPSLNFHLSLMLTILLWIIYL